MNSSLQKANKDVAAGNGTRQRVIPSNQQRTGFFYRMTLANFSLLLYSTVSVFSSYSKIHYSITSPIAPCQFKATDYPCAVVVTGI